MRKAVRDHQIALLSKEMRLENAKTVQNKSARDATNASCDDTVESNRCLCWSSSEPSQDDHEHVELVAQGISIPTRYGSRYHSVLLTE